MAENEMEKIKLKLKYLEEMKELQKEYNHYRELEMFGGIRSVFIGCVVGGISALIDYYTDSRGSGINYNVLCSAFCGFFTAASLTYLLDSPHLDWISFKKEKINVKILGLEGKFKKLN